jgi:hypothetical protein
MVGWACQVGGSCCCDCPRLPSPARSWWLIGAASRRRSRRCRCSSDLSAMGAQSRLVTSDVRPLCVINHQDPALAEYLIHAGQATCWYWWRVPPSRAGRRMSRMGDPVRVLDRCGQRAEGAGVRKALMRPVLVVERLELAQGMQEMALVPDQRAVQQLSPAGLHPPLHDRVHPRHPDAAELVGLAVRARGGPCVVDRVLAGKSAVQRACLSIRAAG